MLSRKRILSITAALAIGSLSAFAQNPSTSTSSAAKKATTTASKPSAAKPHIAEGSVVSSTDDMLTLRSGKKDMNFKIVSTTQKPSSMNPGSNVKVSYHDEGTQHIASSIELAPTKSSATAAKPPAKK